MDAAAAQLTAGPSQAFEPIPLLDFIPALSGVAVRGPKLGLKRPDHLAPIADAFERARRQARSPGHGLRVFATVPPRHGKTELVKHAIVHRLLDDPTLRIGLGGYSQRYAQKRSREIRALYLRAGGRVNAKASSVADWRTGVGDGGVWAGGVGGSWTGEGFDLGILDDPVQGRIQAESEVEREKLWEWHEHDFVTRIEPGGSEIVIHTRWHVDDLGGRLLATGDYEEICIPAINECGEALWPERFPIEVLRQIEKRDAYRWASLYMGRPFARGGRIFGEPCFYDEPPQRPLRLAFGADLAYSKKTSRDWSVILVLGVDDVEEVCYVLDVLRVQARAPEFAKMIGPILSRAPGSEARWYYAGAELGIADFMNTLEGVAIEAIAATADKVQRSQAVASAWNDERRLVRVPRQAEWLREFLREVSAFTGVTDLHDDQIDALAAAYDSAAQPGWVTAYGNWAKRGYGA